MYRRAYGLVVGDEYYLKLRRLYLILAAEPGKALVCLCTPLVVVLAGSCAPFPPRHRLKQSAERACSLQRGPSHVGY